MDAKASVELRTHEAALQAGDLPVSIDRQGNDHGDLAPAGTFQLICAQYLQSPMAFPANRSCRQPPAP